MTLIEEAATFIEKKIQSYHSTINKMTAAEYNKMQMLLAVDGNASNK
jgi:hypothetical protein